jgi:phosphatidylinositol alpha-mannosyltransferase
MQAHPLKILMASDVYHPYPGGITEHVHHLAMELRALGHDVRILTTSFNREEETEDPEYVIRLGRSIRVPANKSMSSIAFAPDITRKIKRVLASGGYDIVHVHGSLAPTMPIFALNYSRSANVATFHAAHESSWAYGLFKPLLKRTFAKIDGLIAVSTVARESMMKYFPGEYAIIPNGIDTDRFRPALEPISTMAERGRRALLFVGRFDPRKGLKYLLQAMPAIVDRVPDVHLTVIGGGPLEKWYRKQLPETLQERIAFEGFVSPEVLPRYFASADLYVSPATGGESFGIVLLEAMASGTPVLASDIPGYRTVMEEGVEGVFFQKENPKALARRAAELLSDLDRCARMGEAGRRKAERLYSWTSVARQVESFYYRVLGESRDGGTSEVDPQGERKAADRPH